MFEPCENLVTFNLEQLLSNVLFEEKDAEKYIEGTLTNIIFLLLLV